MNDDLMLSLIHIYAFLYDVSEPAFGAAFPVPAGAGVPTAAGFGTFVVVPY